MGAAAIGCPRCAGRAARPPFNSCCSLMLLMSPCMSGLGGCVYLLYVRWPPCPYLASDIPACALPPIRYQPLLAAAASVAFLTDFPHGLQVYFPAYTEEELLALLKAAPAAQQLEGVERQVRGGLEEKGTRDRHCEHCWRCK